MAMLLGDLLALQRLSGESEITAMKAGGVGLIRAVAPLLIVGFAVSVVAFGLQEGIVPFANDQAAQLRDETIKHVGAFGGATHTVVTNLPGGGQQVTYFRRLRRDDAETAVRHDRDVRSDNRPKAVLFSDRAQYDQPSWTFFDASIYRFNGDGTTQSSKSRRCGSTSARSPRKSSSARWTTTGSR